MSVGLRTKKKLRKVSDVVTKENTWITGNFFFRSQRKAKRFGEVVFVLFTPTLTTVVLWISQTISAYTNMGGGGGEESNSTEDYSCVHHLSDISNTRCEFNILEPSILEDSGVHFSILLIVLISLTIAFEILDHILMRVQSTWIFLMIRNWGNILTFFSQLEEFTKVCADDRDNLEIMILGLINMIVFLANQTNTLDFKIGEESFDPLLFEFVHLALFLISFIYLILALLFVIVLVRISFRYWANLDNTSSAGDDKLFRCSNLQNKPTLKLFLWNRKLRALDCINSIPSIELD